MDREQIIQEREWFVNLKKDLSCSNIFNIIKTTVLFIIFSALVIMVYLLFMEILGYVGSFVFYESIIDNCKNNHFCEKSIKEKSGLCAMSRPLFSQLLGKCNFFTDYVNFYLNSCAIFTSCILCMILCGVLLITFITIPMRIYRLKAAERALASSGATLLPEHGSEESRAQYVPIREENSLPATDNKMFKLC